MLRPGFIAAPGHRKVELEVVVHAAHRVDKLLDGGHGHGVIIVDRNAAEHPARALAGLEEARPALGVIAAAAVDRGVELIDALYARYLGIGVARQRDEVDAVFVEVDRHDDHDVRVVLMLAVPALALIGIVDADEQHINDVLHHREVGLLVDDLIGIYRGRGGNQRRFLARDALDDGRLGRWRRGGKLEHR